MIVGAIAVLLTIAALIVGVCKHADDTWPIPLSPKRGSVRERRLNG